jgi:hypothetical protein
MALITDGPISGLQDLQDQENAILDVAGLEKLDISAKMALAQSEIERELLKFLLQRPFRDYQIPLRHQIGVGDVVVTTPLRQWHVLRSLALIYRDAFNNQLNDRYKGKWSQYEELARHAAEDYFHIGVGLVANPAPKAEMPLLTTVSGTRTGGTFYVAATWVNAVGQEGAASDIAAITAADGTQLVASTAPAPKNVTGWNVYAGATAQGIARQNAVPLSTGASWTPPDGALAQSPAPGPGQTPERYLANDRVLQRG